MPNQWTKKYPTETHRFLAKVLVDDGCWQWTGGDNGRGYGRFTARGRRFGAHRYMYELLRGPIPDGLTLDHLCRNTRCVRPDHLEPVPHRENVLRGEGFPARKAAQTHCVNGHPFDAANTHRKPDGRRDCRACHREQERLRRARLASHH